MGYRGGHAANGSRSRFVSDAHALGSRCSYLGPSICTRYQPGNLGTSLKPGVGISLDFDRNGSITWRKTMSVVLGAAWLLIVLSCLMLAGESRRDEAP